MKSQAVEPKPLKVKPCPFCGADMPFRFGGKYVMVHEDDCFFYTDKQLHSPNHINWKIWNTRKGQ